MGLSSYEEAQLLGQAAAGIMPDGAFAQTFDRRIATGTLQPTSGTLTMSGIWLPAGRTISSITFVSGGTGETGGTNLWFALYKRDLTLMAQSANDTGATTFGTNLALTKALATAQVTPYSGLYYLGYCSTNSAGTQPALFVLSSNNANMNGSIAGMTPIVAGTSSTGQTTTAPNPAGALATIVQALYAYVS